MISDPVHAAWPGGTMHALSTVGIEVDTIIDEVTAAMPTTVEVSTWALPEGVPLLWVRRSSLDTTGRVVEISDAQYPVPSRPHQTHLPHPSHPMGHDLVRTRRISVITAAYAPLARYFPETIGSVLS
jgi:UTRA domain